MLATRTLLQHKCQAGRCSPKVSARPIDILLSVWVENREQYASCKNMQLICILNHLQGNAIHSSCFAKWNKCHVCNKQPGSITVLSSTCKFEWCFCWCKKGKRILACHQLFQRLASLKELMLQQQMLDATAHLTMLQHQQMNTCHCSKYFSDIVLLYQHNMPNLTDITGKGRKGMKIIPNIYRKCQIS